MVDNRIMILPSDKACIQFFICETLLATQQLLVIAHKTRVSFLRTRKFLAGLMMHSVSVILAYVRMLVNTVHSVSVILAYVRMLANTVHSVSVILAYVRMLVDTVHSVSVILAYVRMLVNTVLVYFSSNTYHSCFRYHCVGSS